METEATCRHCGKTDAETRVHKCPMCHKRACDDCGSRRGGKFFCTPGCGVEFFFGDVDEEDQEGG
jgi:hypothetical protein